MIVQTMQWIDDGFATGNRQTWRTLADNCGPMSNEPLKHGGITGLIIRCFYRVYDRLGWGFDESVYCDALSIELRAAGLSFVREARIAAWYDGRQVRQYRCDFLVEATVIVEVKS